MHPKPMQRHEPTPENSTPNDGPATSLISPFLLVGLCLVFGVFALWIVTVGWVLDLIAGAIKFGTLALGLATGAYVHKGLDKFPNWARVTAAVILGVTMFGVAAQLNAFT